MWRSVDLVKTDVSEECVVYLFRVKRTIELGIRLAVMTVFFSC
jgi:hypothetical protein